MAGARQGTGGIPNGYLLLVASRPPLVGGYDDGVGSIFEGAWMGLVQNMEDGRTVTCSMRSASRYADPCRAERMNVLDAVRLTGPSCGGSLKCFTAIRGL
jgi:hypothetical protein